MALLLAVDIVLRIIYLIIGVFLGVVTFMPNVMISDSGSRSSFNSAYILGMSASVCFIIGGAVSAATGQSMWLLVGITLQICTFLVPAICPMQREEEAGLTTMSTDNA